MRILLAEDEEVAATVLSGTLASWGHDVTVADDGPAAWRLIQQEHFPVVLSDWMMPGIDGLELCRRVRSQAGRPYTYFVMFTGRAGSEDRLEALAAGADDFLGKPFDPRELVARLEIARRLLAIQDELERKNIALRELATTDELTGLKNRRSFFEMLESHFALAARQRSPLSLVLLDVDHFKSYNDAFGHPAGDDLLRRLADVLRSTTRAHDTVARHGGEEFAVLLPATGSVVATGLAGRLRGAIESRDWPHGPVTASFGVATMTLEAVAPMDLVEQADRALYVSKRRGRNRVTHQADLGDGGGPIDGPGWSQPPSPRMVLPIAGVPDAPPTGRRLAPHREDSGRQTPSLDDVVEGLSRAMILRDCETAAHGRRVTATTQQLARALGLDESDMTDIRRGAQLHDIGKMGIPDSILHKPGPLSATEWLVMRRHPAYAVELMAPFEFLGPATDIPHCHHERWDGAGYPRGLKGDQIPLAARAFAAVDIWDALSHDRPYRRAWPEDRVRAHIAELTGTHLDPDVVAALDRTLAE